MITAGSPKRSIKHPLIMFVERGSRWTLLRENFLKGCTNSRKTHLSLEKVAAIRYSAPSRNMQLIVMIVVIIEKSEAGQGGQHGQGQNRVAPPCQGFSRYAHGCQVRAGSHRRGKHRFIVGCVRGAAMDFQHYNPCMCSYRFRGFTPCVSTLVCLLTIFRPGYVVCW